MSETTADRPLRYNPALFQVTIENGKWYCYNKAQRVKYECDAEKEARELSSEFEWERIDRIDASFARMMAELEANGE